MKLLLFFFNFFLLGSRYLRKATAYRNSPAFTILGTSKRKCACHPLNMRTEMNDVEFVISDGDISKKTMKKKKISNASKSVSELPRSESIFSFLSDDFLDSSSPGYTAQTPISTVDMAKLRITQVVLSLTILYLTYTGKMQGFYDRIFGTESKKTEQGGSTIKFRDIKKGQPTMQMISGVPIEAEIKIFYNGLEVQSFPLRTFSYNADTFAADLDSIMPFSGISQALEGLSLGAQRQVIVPPALAYGPAGYPPFVPANATVVLDLALRPPSIVV